MVTNFFLEGEIYFLLFNLTSSWMQEPLHKLQKIMYRMEILENELPITKLNIKPEMQFDVNVRNHYIELMNDGSEEERKPLTVFRGTPYEEVKDQLLLLSSLEAPMSKLEWIYTCCTKEIPKEVSSFWNHIDIPAKKLSIDTD
jgi:hypothetical protein